MGRCVVGVYKSHAEVCFFYSWYRKSRTLRDLMIRCCEVGSVFRTDQWSGCRRIEQDGFLHQLSTISSGFLVQLPKLIPKVSKECGSKLNYHEEK